MSLPNVRVRGGDGAYAPTVVECGRCNDKGLVGPESFPVVCPDCQGRKAVLHGDH